MWNELGISGGNRNCYFDCAVFRYQMGSEKMASKKPTVLSLERKPMSIQNEKELKELGLDSKDQ